MREESLAQGSFCIIPVALAGFTDIRENWQMARNSGRHKRKHSMVRSVSSPSFPQASLTFLKKSQSAEELAPSTTQILTL